ncbi:unnamed protein product [Rhizoctonia solani]|uniref:Uncharacterized protein n=1 Tax=Rhizoctonia solani TaxID=456999 RepID=A0A8H3AF48_9AGAM|nr:unnamed protein product [Rhizoctonia solani]
MVLFNFKVVAALAAATAATVQASEHELESRDWEARRLVPRNFELITTKVTMLVPKGSYKTVTKYKTVTVTGDCGGGSVTTTDTFPLPITTDTSTVPTDTFTSPTLTDTGIPTTPTDTFTGVPTPTNTGLPTDTLTGPPTDTLTGAPTPTNTGLPTLTAGGAGNTTTDPFATPTTTDPFATPSNTLTNPVLDPSSNATNPFASPTTTPGVANANATLAAGDPFASSPTLDIFGTSTDTVVVTITSDPTAPTPTAPSIVKRAVAQVI